jgi:hypothetical protein
MVDNPTRESDYREQNFRPGMVGIHRDNQYKNSQQRQKLTRLAIRIPVAFRPVHWGYMLATAVEETVQTFEQSG